MSVCLDSSDNDIQMTMERQTRTEDRINKYKQSIYRWRRVAMILLLVILCVAAVVAVAFLIKENLMKSQVCENKISIIDLREPKHPSVFHDLTKTEINGLSEYLYKQADLNLSDPKEATVDKSYIFVSELNLASKSDILDFMSGNLDQPNREAKVTIFRGDRKFPRVEEYIVGPLPFPRYHRNIPGIKGNIPFQFRPMSIPEYKEVRERIEKQVEENAGDILEESFGVKLKNCKNNCVSFRTMTPVSNKLNKHSFRKFWFWLTRSNEYFALHPVDFAVLVNTNKRNYTIENVWFYGRSFKNLHHFVKQYKMNSVRSPPRKTYNEENKDFSKMRLEKPSFPEQPLRNPVQVEPDGKRYSVIGQQVKYMNWKFDFRMSSIHGPQLYNIHYQKDMIVFELGLQDIAVFHSGKAPYFKYADYLGTFSLIGAHARSLVLGSDCPSHSTMIDTTHYLESSRKATRFRNSFCVFEHNTGEPLRRHFSHSSTYGNFYEGMESVVLILRTIVTIVNYDYIFDFVFYQNGVIKVKVDLTGYLLPTPYGSEQYGYRIHENLYGNLQFHAFNFKVDLDITDRANRFESLDLKMERKKNVYTNKTTYQTYIDPIPPKHYTHEKQTLYKLNYNSPKYLLIFNENKRNHYRNPRAYRILFKGTDSKLSPSSKKGHYYNGWAQYQLAITKHSEEERFSSSMFSTFDAHKPVVDFQKFVEDNAQIINKDLVAWITLGIHRIPTTEDLPVTHTPGNDVSFYLLPFNYFPQNPAMASRNAIRIDPKEDFNLTKGLKIERYGVPSGVNCVPPESHPDDEILADSQTMFDSESESVTAL